MENFPVKITLYKGYHSGDAFQAFCKAWQQDELVIFLPPTLENYDFVSALPKAEIFLLGELWTGDETLPSPEGEPLSAVAGVFSSGTSEIPRLVFYSKPNIESSVKGIFELFDREKIQNIFCYPQPFHTFGLTLGFGAAWILGLELKFPLGRYSQNHHQIWLESVNPSTLTLGTPTHFYDLLNWSQSQPHIPETYSCIIGGAKVKKDLWLDCRDQLNIREPSIGYGATEASPGITHLPPGVAPREDGEIGLPLPHVDVNLTPSGLQFSGPNLCMAILDQGEIFFPISYELPDIIEVRDSDQHWLYQTRSNWFLNRGGEKFSLEGIESWIKQDVGIEALCVGLPDLRLGEELGVLLLKGSSPIDKIKQEILSCLKKKTKRQFNENLFQFVDQFPLNENLKKDRKQAIQWFSKNQNH